ncbi:hypothetical protein GCM10009696_00140 [Kocuria himachalensis]
MVVPFLGCAWAEAAHPAGRIFLKNRWARTVFEPGGVQAVDPLRYAWRPWGKGSPLVDRGRARAKRTGRAGCPGSSCSTSQHSRSSAEPSRRSIEVRSMTTSVSQVSLRTRRINGYRVR